MTLARQMAERIVAMRADNLPKAALDWSRVGVMDTLGVTLAGVAEEARILFHLHCSRPSSRIAQPACCPLRKW